MRAILAVAAVGVGLALAATAVADDTWAPDALASMRVEEMQALAPWQWEVRADVAVNGRALFRQVRLVKRSATGQLMSVVVEEKPVDPRRPLSHPDRLPDVTSGRRWTAEMDQTLWKYLLAPRDVLEEFFGRVTVQPGPRRLPGTVEVRGKGLLRAGDEVAWWLDAKSGRAVRVEIKTALKEDDVSLSVDFGTTRDGLVYVAGMTGEVPTRNVRTVFNAYGLRKP